MNSIHLIVFMFVYFNASSRVIQTLMYIVKSEFILPQDVNVVRAHHGIFEVKNLVKLIENISIHLIHESMRRCLMDCG